MSRSDRHLARLRNLELKTDVVGEPVFNLGTPRDNCHAPAHGIDVDDFLGCLGPHLPAVEPDVFVQLARPHSTNCSALSLHNPKDTFTLPSEWRP